MIIYQSEWAIGDHVNIDGDTSITGRVTGISFRYDDGHTLEVAWLHNGESRRAYFEHWRLTRAT